MKVIIHQRLMVYSHHEAHVVYETAFCRRNGAASQQNAPSLAPSQFPLIPLLRIRNVSVSYTGRKRARWCEFTFTHGSNYVSQLASGTCVLFNRTDHSSVQI